MPGETATGTTFELVEIDASNWRRALEIEVRDDQVPFVAHHQPVALVILAKCFVRPAGQTWTPWLALEDGSPVGVLGVAAEGDNAHIRHFAIDHRRQGRGLGRKMVTATIDVIVRTQPQCRSVIVTAHPDNEIALALYLSAGFTRTGAFSGIEPLLSLDLD